MPSKKKDDLLEDQKIELILIGQTHSIPKIKDHGVPDQEIINNVIYSQFRILQIVQAFPEAVVLSEGIWVDITEKHQKKEYKHGFQTIFPQYQDFQKMEFQALNHDQKTILTNNQATQVLFQLGVIPAIYQTTRNSSLDPQIYHDFTRHYLETIAQFPRLLARAPREQGVRLKDLRSIEELHDYEKFMEILHTKIPGMFLNREKEALDFVLTAAKKSGKKQALLIFGRDHAQGFLNLLNTVYKDQIVLKEYIDSSAGFPNQDALTVCQLQTTEGMKLYNKFKYMASSELFAKTVAFWKATPHSTPNKLKSLLVAEYNLGSSLFKLAELETSSYEQSIVHLKQAVDLAEKIHEPQNCKKYMARHNESIRRALVLTIFGGMPSPRIGHLISVYSDDTETLAIKR